MGTNQGLGRMRELVCLVVLLREHSGGGVEEKEEGLCGGRVIERRWSFRWANSSLLEEMEPKEICDLIREGKSWWSQWFLEIRKWSEVDMDNERVTWIRCFRVAIKEPLSLLDGSGVDVLGLGVGPKDSRPTLPFISKRSRNSKFGKNMDSNMGKKVWKAIYNLGIVPKGKSRDYKKKIEEMEVNDKKRMLALKG
ncbi:hypothetical protein KIW84_076277 [Lathyrus oleraceus]|uniref:Uncharacterized protein n=1 Tax=Pisum sativum TaxID=3888 RepID=A0A9D4VW22_PEA|nr:hypothetical protein KIW84_076277 [Pisum sativum]